MRGSMLLKEKSHTYTNSGQWESDRGLEQEAEAHRWLDTWMFSLQPLAWQLSFPSLSVLTPHSHLLGSQRSTLPLSISFRCRLPFVSVVLPTAQPLHWQRAGSNPSHSPPDSACWILQLLELLEPLFWAKQEGQQTDRGTRTDRLRRKMYSAKNTKPQKHKSNARDKTFCDHTTVAVCLWVRVWVCAWVCVLGLIPLFLWGRC